MNKMKAKNEQLAPICEALSLIKSLQLTKRLGKIGVLIYLLSNADGDFLIRKSIAKVAAETGIDYGTVQTTFNKLYESGIVTPKAYCVYEIHYKKLIDAMEKYR